MKILFLEDNLDFAGPLIEVAELLGHVIIHTQNVVEAAQIFSKGNFDAIISDIHLKKGSSTLSSGLDFVRFIRERRHSDIVIAVTTGLELLQEKDIREHGIDIFYYKPIKIGLKQFIKEIDEEVETRNIKKN